MVFKGKVEELGEAAQKEAIEWIIQGLSYSAVADKLNEKYHTNITSQIIGSFYKRNKNKAFQIAKGQRNFDQKMAKHYFDTLSQLNQLNSEMWSFFLEIKKNPELKDKIIKCTYYFN